MRLSKFPDNMPKKLKVLNIVGARPNFMKIAPLFRAYKKYKNIDPVLIHTNQHSQEKMSGVFFKSLGIPKPHKTLNVDHSSVVSTISGIMSELEIVLLENRPDLVIVVGDVTSTLAAAIAANKLGIKVAHVESGLRSKDRDMPEEINRIIVDHISDMLFVTENDGMKNLKREGVQENRVFFTGNVMIDNLIFMLPKINQSKIVEKLSLKKDPYALMTMHRPVNVDSKKALLSLIKLQKEITDKLSLRIVFPIHPRTLRSLEKYGIFDQMKSNKGLVITDPLDYVDFIKLAKEASVILTDSGGIQEEAAYLKVPTVTLRESTERPSTIECGANRLCSIGDPKLLDCISRSINKKRASIKKIPLNDGKSSERIIETIIRLMK